MYYVKKDYLFLAPGIYIFHVFALAVFIVPSALITHSQIQQLSFIMSCFIFSIFFTSILYEKDGKTDGGMLLLAGSLSRKQLLAGRYLSCMAAIIIHMTLCMIAALLLLPFMNISSGLHLPGICISFFIASSLISIFIPLFTKYGYQKSQGIFLLIIVLLSFAPVLIQKISAIVNLRLLIHILSFIYRQYYLFLISAAFCLVISYKIALRAYQKKEF